MTTRKRLLAVSAVALVTLTGLSACTPPREDSAPPDAKEIRLSAPATPLTAITDADERTASLTTSRELFDASPAVVIAPAGEPKTQYLAALAAVGLGVPLLISNDTAEESTEPASSPSAEQSSAPADALADEIARLGATSVLAVGDVSTAYNFAGADGDDAKVVRIEADASAITDATGVPMDALATDDPARYPTAIAGLTAGTPDHEPSDNVPDFAPAAPLTDTVVLAVDAAPQLASLATARSAGVALALVPADNANPQASATAISALHGAAAANTMAIGAEFATQEDLDWKLRSAASGFALPGGGQLLFPEHQFVALYGTPGTGSLGVLGEQDAAGAVQRTTDMAATYQPLTDKSVVPMFEIIATVAAGDAGPDGNYSNELDPAKLRPWIDAASEAGIYVVLDLQPGRTDFLTQAKQYESLLALPNVGLAIDPEWRLAADQVPLRQIGSVGAAEVNSVTEWLADLTNKNGLPQKMFVLHQFQLRMLQDRTAINTGHPELAMAIHADGQGSQPDKQATWRALHQDAPANIAWGWKNFYDEDTPMLTPEQTMGDVSPLPDLITYQ
ncbi:MAG: hypothetical protein JWQ43_151 [Glaciihabitans sp.]|nr:hypothetical protein [Glaciihabitans sp.]